MTTISSQPLVDGLLGGCDQQHPRPRDTKKQERSSEPFLFTCRSPICCRPAVLSLHLQHAILKEDELQQPRYTSAHFLHLFDCIFSVSFIHFLFKGVYHLSKIGFKDTLLCLGCARISMPCCSGVAVLWMCHTALDFVDCVWIKFQLFCLAAGRHGGRQGSGLGSGVQIWDYRQSSRLEDLLFIS